MWNKKQTSSGFTIVELLIVIVVVAILAVIVTVAFNGVRDKAVVGAIETELSQASKKLETLRFGPVSSGLYPVDYDDTGLPQNDALTYQYKVNNNTQPPSYCLSISNDDISYRVDTATFSPASGNCDDFMAACLPGFISVPGNELFSTEDFCVAKYEAKNVGGVAVSQPSGTPWGLISQVDAVAAAAAACDGCHLITEAEWLTIMHDVLNVSSNWSGGTVGVGYIYKGHTDGTPAEGLVADENDENGYAGTGQSGVSPERRTLTLSNGEVIWDFSGNIWEWTADTVTGGQPGAGSNAWRQWNAIAGTGSLSPNPFPAYGTPAASNWTNSQGIGRVYSNTTFNTLRAIRRGGSYGDNVNAGVASMNLASQVTDAAALIGFRIAQ